MQIKSKVHICFCLFWTSIPFVCKSIVLATLSWLLQLYSKFQTPAVWFLPLYCFLKSVSAFLLSLPFHIYFRICLSVSTKILPVFFYWNYVVSIEKSGKNLNAESSYLWIWYVSLHFYTSTKSSFFSICTLRIQVPKYILLYFS